LANQGLVDLELDDLKEKRWQQHTLYEWMERETQGMVRAFVEARVE
jgi:hypothetical protein